MQALTVTHHFASYKPGDKITDPAVIAAVLSSDNASRVVRITVPDKK